MIHEMYSHDFEYPDHTTKIPRVDFYGNDGVCLFKYFVKKAATKTVTLSSLAPYEN